MKKILYFVAITFYLAACTTEETAAQVISEDCPPEGSAKETRLQELNKLKNRAVAPTINEIDTTITLKKILVSGDDHARWSELKGAIITGYVYDVKPGGIETCNCKTKDPDLRDTHIELLVDPMNNDKLQRMIVEITPRIRKLMKEKGEDWSTKHLRDKLLGRWVTFTGWMLFDAEHASQAENTNPGRPRNWRATAWEIHPVTSLSVTTKPH